MELVTLCHHLRTGMVEIKLEEVAVLESIFHLTGKLDAVGREKEGILIPFRSIAAVVLGSVVEEGFHEMIITEDTTVVKHGLDVHIIIGGRTLGP